jgi:hypothetical protein
MCMVLFVYMRARQLYAKAVLRPQVMRAVSTVEVPTTLMTRDRGLSLPADPGDANPDSLHAHPA